MEGISSRQPLLSNPFSKPLKKDLDKNLVRLSSYQETFDHDKGQRSAISGRRVHWRLSIGFFAFLQ